jgi:flagellar L-ring protein precursor FlgH
MRRIGLRGWIVAGLFLWQSLAAAQSLYDEKTFVPLTADRKAFRVGDLLTVQVFETATASADADTGTSRSNAVSAELTRAHQPMVHVGIGTGGEFEGGGRTTRTGRLLAQITVSVAEVLPNGDLRIAGEQVLLINDEQQRIGIEGRVRSQDVSDANVVLSSRIADARITYVGEGTLAERQKPAWWRQVLAWMGL